MGLAIRMRIACSVVYRHAIRLKFGDTFLTFLTKLILKTKASISLTIKEILLLYCRKCLAFFVVIINNMICTKEDWS